MLDNNRQRNINQRLSAPYYKSGRRIGNKSCLRRGFVRRTRIKGRQKFRGRKAFSPAYAVRHLPAGWPTSRLTLKTFTEFSRGTRFGRRAISSRRTPPPEKYGTPPGAPHACARSKHISIAPITNSSNTPATPAYRRLFRFTCRETTG